MRLIAILLTTIITSAGMLIGSQNPINTEKDQVSNLNINTPSPSCQQELDSVKNELILTRVINKVMKQEIIDAEEDARYWKEKYESEHEKYLKSRKTAEEFAETIRKLIAIDSIQNQKVDSLEKQLEKEISLKQKAETIAKLAQRELDIHIYKTDSIFKANGIGFTEGK